MIIEVEGCDCSGKTTYAKKVAEMKGFKYFKFETAAAMKSLHDYDYTTFSLGMVYGFVEAAQKIGFNVVADRLMLSNYVYSKLVCRKEVSFKEVEDFYKANRGFVELRVLLISEDKLKERMAARGDEHFNIERVLLANKMYRELAKALGPLADVVEVV